MDVKSIVKINRNKIKKLDNSSITALLKTAEALHTDVVQSQVIPFASGALQGDSTFVDDSDIRNGIVSIISSTPYARRLYYHPEYNFSTDENPNAKGNWYDDWVDGDKKDFCKNTFKELYRQESGL